jgi:hypothetical protein
MPHASLRVAASHSEDMYTGSCVACLCIALQWKQCVWYACSKVLYSQHLAIQHAYCQHMMSVREHKVATHTHRMLLRCMVCAHQLCMLVSVAALVIAAVEALHVITSLPELA